MTWGTVDSPTDILKAGSYHDNPSGPLTRAFAGPSSLGNAWPPPAPKSGESQVDYMTRALGGDWTPGTPFMVQVGNEIQGDVTSWMNDVISGFTLGAVSWSDILGAVQSAETVHGHGGGGNAMANVPTLSGGKVQSAATVTKPASTAGGAVVMVGALASIAALVVMLRRR